MPPYHKIGVVTSGYLATGALSGDEDRPYMVKNVDDGETLPTSAELRSKKRRIGWMIFGTVMLGFILVIGLVVGLQKSSVVVDPIGFMGNETEEIDYAVVDVDEPVVETLVDEQQPIDSMDMDEESVEEEEEVDMPLFEDSVVSLGSSEDVDSSSDVSSDVSSPVGVMEEEAVVEDEEELSSPSFNLDTTNAINEEEEQEEGTTSTHDHNHAHVGSNDVVSSDDTSEHDESNHNPFEPEVAIGMAALLNQISSEGNGTTTVSPSSSPTKSPVAVTSEPTKAPTNEVRNVVGVVLCISYVHIL